jgi:hypothetical protein
MKEFAFEVGLIARVRVRAADEASAGSWVGAPSERASFEPPGQRPVPPPSAVFLFYSSSLTVRFVSMPHTAHT